MLRFMIAIRLWPTKVNNNITIAFAARRYEGISPAYAVVRCPSVCRHVCVFCRNE